MDFVIKQISNLIFKAFVVSPVPNIIGEGGSGMAAPDISTGIRISYFFRLVEFFTQNETRSYALDMDLANDWHNCSTLFNCTHAILIIDNKTFVHNHPILNCTWNRIYAAVGAGE